jgi:hypothetical protein
MTEGARTEPESPLVTGSAEGDEEGTIRYELERGA